MNNSNWADISLEKNIGRFYTGPYTEPIQVKKNNEEILSGTLLFTFDDNFMNGPGDSGSIHGAEEQFIPRIF